jgi:hypothetical protein
MRRSLWARVALIGGLCLVAATATAQWTPVVPGIDYRAHRLESPPNDVFVTRMDRTSTSVIVDAALANGRIGQPGSAWNTETVPAQVARYDGAFGFWGRETARYRYRVVAAINGNGFSTANGFPDSAMAIGGALVKRTYGPTSSEAANAMGFLYKMGGTAPTPGTPYMAGNAGLPADPSKNRLSFPDGNWMRFHALNDTPRTNSVIVYTHHFGATTPAATGTLEIVVQTENHAPLRILPWSNFVRGTAREIRAGSSGQTPIPFDGYVLVASGSAATELAARVTAVGAEVRLSQEVADSSGVDWTNMYTAMGPMWGVILRNGAKPSTTSTSYTTDIHPRTAVAYSAQYIYFVVVDGRSARSSGMTLSALADYCRDELGATDAVNNDGGGSSTMWVDGSVRNVPSDGSLRAVANALMMIQLEPREQAIDLRPGTTARTRTPGTTLSLRTGPGLHFHTLVALPDSTMVTIQPHTLNGLRAQTIAGQPSYWWLVTTPDNRTGWVARQFLEPPATATTSAGWSAY